MQTIARARSTLNNKNFKMFNQSYILHLFSYVLDPLELEFWMVMSHYVGAGN